MIFILDACVLRQCCYSKMPVSFMDITTPPGVVLEEMTAARKTDWLIRHTVKKAYMTDSLVSQMSQPERAGAVLL